MRHETWPSARNRIFRSDPAAKRPCGTRPNHAAWFFLLNRQFDSALRQTQTMIEFEGPLGHCLAVSGRQKEARRMLERLEACSEQEYVEPYGLCLIHLGLGEMDKALFRLEQAVTLRSVWSSLQLLSDTRLDLLRPDPHFGELIARMHLGSSAAWTLFEEEGRQASQGRLPRFSRLFRLH